MALAQRQEPVLAIERHYTPSELAELWGVDRTTIQRIFRDVPGVLKLGKSNRRDGKKDYISLRIPQSIAVEFHRKHSGVK